MSHNASSSYGEIPRSWTVAIHLNSVVLALVILPMNFELASRTARSTRSRFEPDMISELVLGVVACAIVPTAKRCLYRESWCWIPDETCSRKYSSSLLDVMSLTAIRASV